MLWPRKKYMTPKVLKYLEGDLLGTISQSF